MIMVCPRCDDQGLIYRAKIVDLGIIIKLCDECEACWLEDEIVSMKNFKGLTPFLKGFGLSYAKTKIEDLGYIEVIEESYTS